MTAEVTPIRQPESAIAGIYLNDRGRELVARITRLAHDNFAPRAARYDEECLFPQEDFDDLYARTIPVFNDAMKAKGFVQIMTVKEPEERREETTAEPDED